MKKNKGFTLLIAIIVTSMLLIVSFVVVNIALKQLILSSAAKESQYAFYAADGGTECAVYWDLANELINNGSSAFATSTPGKIDCNHQSIGTGGVYSLPQTDFLPGPVRSLVGGGGSGSVSIFQLNFTKGCAIVKIFKVYDLYGVLKTTIDSRGYNTCDLNATRRFERGVRLTY
jgi:hypothetical protein